MKKKKISQKSRRQFKQLLNYYYKLNEEKTQLEIELSEESEKALKLLSLVPSWAPLYSFSPAEIVILFFVKIGWVDRLETLVAESNRMENYLSLFKDVYENDFDEDTQEHIDSFDDEEMGSFLAVLFAMLGNLEGVKMYHQSVSDWIRVVENTSIDRKERGEALMKAVAIDRSVVAHPTVAKRISIAQVMKNEAFFDQLIKAIKRTKPRRLHELDDARVIAEFMSEAEGLDTYSIEELADFFMNELDEIYPADRGTSAFKKFLKKRKDIIGK